MAEPDNHHHGQSVFALERKENIGLTKERMLPSEDIDIEEYFDGCFGINHSDNPKPETIRIKVYGAQESLLGGNEEDSREDVRTLRYTTVMLLLRKFIWVK